MPPVRRWFITASNHSWATVSTEQNQLSYEFGAPLWYLLIYIYTSYHHINLHFIFPFSIFASFSSLKPPIFFPMAKNPPIELAGGGCAAFSSGRGRSFPGDVSHRFPGMVSSWENHRKTIGKWWFNGILMGFTLWLCQNSYWTWPLK